MEGLKVSRGWILYFSFYPWNPYNLHFDRLSAWHFLSLVDTVLDFKDNLKHQFLQMPGKIPQLRNLIGNFPPKLLQMQNKTLQLKKLRSDGTNLMKMDNTLLMTWDWTKFNSKDCLALKRIWNCSAMLCQETDGLMEFYPTSLILESLKRTRIKLDKLWMTLIHIWLDVWMLGIAIGELW